MIYRIKEKWSTTPITVKVSMAYAVCSILQKCLSFITLPLFTRLLTTEQYGQYTIYSSWEAILMIFLTLDLAFGSFQTAMIKYDKKREEYISSLQGICLLLSLIFLIVYLPFKNQWNKFFELPTVFVLLMVLEVLFMTATQFWMEKNKFEYKYKGVVVVTLLISILAPVIAFIFVSVTNEKGYARTLGYALVNIFVGFCIFVYNCKKGKKLFDKQFWKYALGFNIPLLPYYLSQVIFNQSDRIMISQITGKSDAAMYGIAYNLAMILIFVLQAINGSYVPWIYRKIKNGQGEENKSVSVALVILMSLLILGVIWFSPEIITIMAGKQYAAAVYVVPPVAMSLLLLFYCQLFINVEFYYEEKKALAYSSIGAAIVNVVLNYLFIPKFGFVAAGYTTLASYIIFALSNYSSLQNILKRRDLPNNMYNYKLLTIIFMLFAFISFVGVTLYNNLLIRLIITIIVLGIVVFNKNKFISIFKDLRRKEE